MTYYEELGLTPAAREGDIRKAHRTLSKLLHPDQQTDPAVRQAAELQMRRINGIIDVLLNGERRRGYDESLVQMKPDPPPLLPRHWLSDRLRFEDSAFGVLTTAVAAIALTVAAVWFFAGDSIHFRTSAAAAPVMRNEPASAPVAPQPLPTHGPETPRKPVLHAEAGEPREDAQSTADDASGSIETASLKPNIQMPPASVAVDLPFRSQPDSTRPLAGSAEPPLAGTWMYAPSTLKAETSQTPLYAPEYIELRIRLNGDTLYGEYSSQYRVPDRAISPRVRFSFQGRPSGQTTFEWRANDGSRGSIDLDLLSRGSLRANWRVTEFGSSIGLGAGTAVLIRRIGS